MAKSAHIIATAIPDGIDKDNGLLRLHLLLTPRLPDSGTLGEDYPQIQHWYEYASLFEEDLKFDVYRSDKNPAFSVNFKNRKPVGITANMRKEYWLSMFPGVRLRNSIPVSGWDINAAPYELLSGLTREGIIKEMKQALLEGIDEYMQQRAGDDIIVGSNAQRRDANLEEQSAMINYLKELRNAGHYETILTDPVIARSDHPALQKLFKKLEEIEERFNHEMFQNNLMLQNEDIERHNTDAIWEFHKRFAAYSNHPELLKRTGWLFEYTISLREWTGLGGGLLQEGYIKLAQAQHYNSDAANELYKVIFENRVNVFSPATKFRFDRRQYFTTAELESKKPTAEMLFRQHSGPASYIDDATGYVYISNAATSTRITAYQVDKVQLLTGIQDKLKRVTDAEAAKAQHELNQNDRRIKEALETEKAFQQEQLLSGGSEYVSQGITLAIVGIRDMLENWMEHSPEATPTAKEAGIEDSLVGKSIIYRHNIVQGYRVDVVANNPFLSPADIARGMADRYYESLCSITEVYEYLQTNIKEEMFPGAGTGQLEMKEVQDIEGWVAIASVLNRDKQLQVSEEITRWNDWNLICRQPGIHEQELDQESLYGLDVTTKAPAGSAVPLRFLWSYQFGLRYADVCGSGGKKMLNQPTNGQLLDFFTNAIDYKRLDSINSPLVFLGTELFVSKDQNVVDGLKPLKESTESTDVDIFEKRKQDKARNFPNWLPERMGEDVHTLVIRSVEKNGKMIFMEGNETTRYLSPPRANLQFVMQHGAIDPFLKENTAPGQKVLKSEAVKAFRNELFARASVKIDARKHKVIKKADAEIDHLYDPVFNGYELIFDHLVRARIETGQSMFEPASPTKPKKAYWRNNRYLPVHVVNWDKAGTSSFVYDIQYDKADPMAGVTIKLRQGAYQELMLGCVPAAKFFTKDYTELFYPGIPIVRRSKIKLIHAVQKPTLLTTVYGNGRNFMPVLYNLASNTAFAITDERRTVNDTAVSIDMEFSLLPVRTSGQYLLYLHCLDFKCDRTKPNGYSLEKISKVILNDVAILNNEEERNVRVENIRHILDDARHYRVLYTLEAVSKFREYYPKDKSFSVLAYSGLQPDYTGSGGIVLDGEGRMAKLSAYTADGKNAAQVFEMQTDRYGFTRLPASKKPDAPRIFRIVPLTKQTSTTVGGRTVIERTCDRVRIYFTGDWYSSGPGERLAVFFVPVRDKGFHSLNTLFIKNGKESTSVSTIISQMGEDPAADIRNLDDQDYNKDLFIDDKFLLDCGSGYEHFNEGLTLGNMEFEFPKESGDPASVPKDLPLEAAVYPVAFINHSDLMYQQPKLKQDPEDEGKGLFYVDVCMNNEVLKNHYMPFIRLAIARYQPDGIDDRGNSGMDLRFSRIILTDFFQPLPYRRVEIAADIMQYDHPAIRVGNTGAEKLKNEIYLFEKSTDADKDEGRLWEYGKDSDQRADSAQFQVKEIAGGHTAMGCAKGKTYLLEEYERFDKNAVGEDPAHVHSRRLIFSCQIDTK